MSALKEAMLGDTLYGDEYPLAPGFARNSETSRAAAESVKPIFTLQQKRIVDFLQERGEQGATYIEIADGTGLFTASICGRLRELATAGTVIIDGKRPTPSGRMAGIYKLSVAARCRA